MTYTFIHSFVSEWKKLRRSAASLLVTGGAFIIPLILTIARFVRHERLYSENTSPHYWQSLYFNSWQLMAILLLPMGVIMATSLITQMEFRNNTWKQLHASPQPFGIIFLAKLSVILVMLLQFFLLFNIGIWLTGMLPAVFFRGIPFPLQDFPLLQFLRLSGSFFVSCLPIVGLQFLLSLHLRNFLLPLGAGIALLVGSLIALSWKYGYTIPYSYCAYQFFSGRQMNQPQGNIQLWALIYFGLFILAACILYIFKKDKS